MVAKSRRARNRTSYKAPENAVRLWDSAYYALPAEGVPPTTAEDLLSGPTRTRRESHVARTAQYHDLVRRVTSVLNDSQRAVLSHMLCGESVEEIARSLHTSTPVVEFVVFLLRAKAREALGVRVVNNSDWSRSDRAEAAEYRTPADAGYPCKSVDGAYTGCVGAARGARGCIFGGKPRRVLMAQDRVICKGCGRDYPRPEGIRLGHLLCSEECDRKLDAAGHRYARALTHDERVRRQEPVSWRHCPSCEARKLQVQAGKPMRCIRCGLEGGSFEALEAQAAERYATGQVPEPPRWTLPY